MDREQLKQIIIEEIKRALREVTADPETLPSGGVDAPKVAGQRGGTGIVVYTGSVPPAASFLESLAGVQLQGYEAAALLSFSFRSEHGGRGAAVIGGIRVIPNPDDESALDAVVRRAAWVIVPDISSNTLTKLTLGIEDSVPTRVIAAALRSGKPTLFVESADLSVRGEGTDRLALLRKLTNRGAIKTSPAEVCRVLYEATRPEEDRLFKPSVPRPEIKHRIITKEDVYEASRRGVVQFIVPDGAIVTPEAREDAQRRGMTIRTQSEL